MPVRIYDISKKLGLGNKEVLAKARQLGITLARVASSNLDKITAEYLEEQLRATHPRSLAPPAPPGPPPPPEPAQALEAAPAGVQVPETISVTTAPPPPVEARGPLERVAVSAASLLEPANPPPAPAPALPALTPAPAPVATRAVSTPAPPPLSAAAPKVEPHATQLPPGAKPAKPPLGEINPPSSAQVISMKPPVMVQNLADCLKKVSLAPKQKLANPWDTIEQKYPVGAKVKGRVVNLVPYGAFVDLEPGVEGLVHVTELSWTKRIAKPSDVLKADQEIEAVVLGISREEQKVSLGLRQLEIELEAPGVGVRRNSEPRDAGNTGATKAEAHGNGASAHVKAESRLIIVDGLNVMNYGRVRGARGIDLRTLLTALVAIAQTGRDFHCIFDAKTHPVLKRFQPSQLPALETLLRAHSHWFSLVTGGGEADYFILSQADAEGCSVLSNDKFADYENKFPWLSEDRLRPVKGKDGRKMQVQDQRIMRGWLIRGQVSIPQLRINQAVEGDLNVLLERLGAALSALAPAAA